MSRFGIFLILVGAVVAAEGNSLFNQQPFAIGTKVARELALQVRAILRGERSNEMPKCKNSTITVEKCTCNCTCKQELGNCTLLNGTNVTGRNCSCNATASGTTTKPKPTDVVHVNVHSKNQTCENTTVTLDRCTCNCTCMNGFGNCTLMNGTKPSGENCSCNASNTTNPKPTNTLPVDVTNKNLTCKNKTVTLERCTCNCTCLNNFGNCTLLNGTKPSGENCSCNATIKPKPTEPLDVAIFFVDMTKHILGTRLAGACYLQELPVEERQKLYGINGLKELELNLMKLISTKTTPHEKLSQDYVKGMGEEITDKCGDYVTYRITAD